MLDPLAERINWGHHINCTALRVACSPSSTLLLSACPHTYCSVQGKADAGFQVGDWRLGRWLVAKSKQLCFMVFNMKKKRQRVMAPYWEVSQHLSSPLTGLLSPHFYHCFPSRGSPCNHTGHPCSILGNLTNPLRRGRTVSSGLMTWSRSPGLSACQLRGEAQSTQAGPF